MRKAPILAGLFIGVATCGAADAHNPTTPPEAKAVGRPIDCLPITSLDQSEVYGDDTIDFHTKDGKIFRNTLPASCPQLGFEEKFSYATSTSQLCSTDIITVLISPGITRGSSCGLGQFQQVETAAK